MLTTRRIIAVVCCGWVLLMPSLARGQSYVPYSDFAAMSESDLAGVMVKLTYLGSQLHSCEIRTRAFSPSSFDVEAFRSFRRAGHEAAYDNDDCDTVYTYSASAHECKSLIDALVGYPGITDGGMDSAYVVSFALLNALGTVKVFESLLDSASADTLFGVVESLMSGNVDLREAFRGMACALDLLRGQPPSDVTGSVDIVLSALRFVAQKGTYLGKVTVTNTSQSALDAPLYLIVPLANWEASIVGADGRTCHAWPRGADYFILLSEGSLGRRGAVEREVEVLNPAEEKIVTQWVTRTGVTVGPRVLSGSGIP